MIDLQLWKERKKALKLSLQDIANETGISLSTLKDIFRGATTDPRIETVQRIEKVLGVEHFFTPPANALMELRLKAGLTREQMAQKLGIKEVYLYDFMEFGALAINKKYLQIICDAFGVTMEYLLGKSVKDIEDLAGEALEEERKRIGQQLRDIEFILSAAPTVDRMNYYHNLSEERQAIFVTYLLATKEDLVAYKESLIAEYFNADEFTVYQEKQYLWKQTETTDEQ